MESNQALENTDQFINAFVQLSGTNEPDLGNQNPQPSGETPVEPKGEESKGEEPKSEEPKGEEPKGEEPKGEEPKGEESQLNYEELYKKEVQRTASWGGRLSAAERRNAELAQKLQEVEKSSVKPDDKPLVDLSDPLIKGFIEEMGDDFIKPLDAYIQNKINSILGAVKPVLDKLPVIEQTLLESQTNTAEEHNSAILKAHSDVVEILESGELENYVNSLPYVEAVQAKTIMQKGKTQQVIDLLDKFKQSKKPQVASNKPTKDKVESATAVKGGSVAIPKGKADVNDFEGAFNEATAQ